MKNKKKPEDNFLTEEDKDICCLKHYEFLPCRICQENKKNAAVRLY